MVRINQMIAPQYQKDEIVPNRKLALLLFVISILISFGACTTIPTRTTKGYTQLCQSLVGEDSKNLLDRWGYPVRTLKATEGNEVYVYREIINPYSIDITDYTALVAYPPFIWHPDVTGDVVGGFLAGENCVTYFEVNKSSKIVKAVWKGDCRAEETE